MDRGVVVAKIIGNYNEKVGWSRRNGGGGGG